MARKRKVFVFIYLPGETNAVPAGIFTHYPDDGIGRFEYGLRYLERPNALLVDPVALPLGRIPREVSSNGGLYGAFRDASPDYWGRLVIAADAGTPPEALGEMDYLLQANASRAGNLDFRLSLEQGEPELAPPSFQSLETLLDAANRLQAGEIPAHDLLRLLEQGTSVGGARPKCTVELEDALWIAKFPARGDTINFPRVEYATMSLASKCGITIPDIRLVRAGKKDVLLVRRFDREKFPNGYHRRGFVSALSLLELDERDRASWSYPLLADRMRSATLAELFRLMLFNICCRNTDDHPRNHGFLLTDGAWGLSPAYDIVPTLTRPGVNTGFSLSMTVGAKGREGTVSNALSMAARFGLKTPDAEQHVTKIKLVASGWEEHFKSCDVSAVDMEAVRACFTG